MRKNVQNSYDDLSTADQKAGEEEEPRRIARDIDVRNLDMDLLRPRNRPPKEALDPFGRIKVQTKTHWMALSHIDSVEQSFVALLWVQLNWHLRMEKKDVDDAKCWKPGVGSARC